MLKHCDWCGHARDEMETHAVETTRGWLTDPFHKTEPRFFACSDPCKTAAAAYYAEYRGAVRTWAMVFLAIFSAAFAISLPFGYPVLRWAMPAAIALGGIWLIRRPYANSFRRDKVGCLKTSLKRSRLEGRLTGIFFVAIAIAFAYFNTILPSDLIQP